MRRILHIDMDAFFAMIEQKRRPEKVRLTGIRIGNLEKVEATI